MIDALEREWRRNCMLAKKYDRRRSTAGSATNQRQCASKARRYQQKVESLGVKLAAAGVAVGKC